MKKHLLSIVLALLFLLSISACKSFSAGVPEGLIGNWKCEEYASDGETDTSFYAMRIKHNGEFSIYDAAAGNPGISGLMGNDTDNTIECRFNMDDFDVPFCWTINSSKATLNYEIKDDTLKLGHNGVWMIFHRASDKEEDNFIPEPIDDLISINLPSEFSIDMEFSYGSEEGNPIVQKSYMSEKKGYFSVGIFSYKGWDCMGNIDSTVDLDDYLNYLDKKQHITVDGETGFFGTHESDDMPDMAAVVYVAHGDYIFEFRLTNCDEQVTDEQLTEFKQIVSSTTFKH